MHKLMAMMMMTMSKKSLLWICALIVLFWLDVDVCLFLLFLHLATQILCTIVILEQKFLRWLLLLLLLSVFSSFSCFAFVYTHFTYSLNLWVLFAIRACIPSIWLLLIDAFYRTLGNRGKVLIFCSSFDVLLFHSLSPPSLFHARANVREYMNFLTVFEYEIGCYDHQHSFRKPISIQETGRWQENCSKCPFLWSEWACHVDHHHASCRALHTQLILQNFDARQTFCRHKWFANIFSNGSSNAFQLPLWFW